MRVRTSGRRRPLRAESFLARFVDDIEKVVAGSSLLDLVACDMQVPRGCREMTVAEEDLDGADVDAALQQMSREAMT